MIRVTNEHFAVGLILVVGAFLQLLLILSPLSFLLGNVLPDDAFYYFEIARNISLGYGSTFDGVTPTNGYHPLWMVLLVPLYELAHMFSWDSLVPIRIALGFSVLCNLITWYVVYKIVSLFTDKTFIKLFSLAVFVFNPFLLYELVNGLETSLGLMLTSTFLLFALSLKENASTTSYSLLGLLGGLMILARLDLIFLVGGVGLYFCMKEWNQKEHTFKKTLTIGLSALVLVVPFFIWNFITYGTILTSASGANELVNHALIVQDNGDSLYQSIKAVFYNLHGQLRDLMIHAGAPEVALLFVGAFFAFIGLGKISTPKSLKEFTILHGFLIGFMLLFVLNVAVRFTARTWYFVSFGILFSLLIVFVLREVDKGSTLALRQRVSIGIFLVVFVFASFFVWWHKELRNHLGLQNEMHLASMWFNEQVGGEAVVGVFNAGVQGYFTDARVVNLDGLVNNRAYEAMKEKELWKYIQDAGITHISDFDIYIDYRYRSFYGIESLRPHLKHITDLQLETSKKSDHGISIYEVLP